MIFNPPEPILAPSAGGDFFPVRRIFCVARNYAAHAREMGMDLDQEPPFFFTKWAETVVRSGTIVAYPPRTSNFHYEGELVVAIGGGGRDIEPSVALDHVYGYATGLDMTRRDLQAAARDKGQPWDSAKNFEQAAPLGMIHPVSEVGHMSSGRIHLTVNDQIRQDADLSDMMWSVPHIISFLSRLYRLEQGDLIYTGTPAGVGPVVPGDVIKVSIERLTPTEISVGVASDQ